MGNAYSPVSEQKRYSTIPSAVRNDRNEAWDGDGDADMVSLLAENARLRALVVRLSDLVLRNVADYK